MNHETFLLHNFCTLRYTDDSMDSVLNEVEGIYLIIQRIVSVMKKGWNPHSQMVNSSAVIGEIPIQDRA